MSNMLASTTRKKSLIGAIAVLLLAAFGWACFGFVRSREPQALTILFTCDAAGELKPCG
ncbi:MAG: hypothetical protein ABIH26_15200 [Candidatus Eisenbacteria bacterium]